MSRLPFLLGNLSLAALILAGRTHAAPFREYPIGDPVEKNFLKIAAVYFPAVPMDHASMGHAGHATADDAATIAKEKFVKPGAELVHMEADIHAIKNNPNGFGVGEWIPYLTVSFELTNVKTKEVQKGDFMPMVAKDGPHYGTTLRMSGKGKYVLKYKISAPVLARHSDPTTGVADYWKPFEVNYAFDYEGLPRK